MENRVAREKRADFADKSVSANKLSEDNFGKLQKRVFTEHNRVGGHDFGGLEASTECNSHNRIFGVSLVVGV